MCVVHTYAASDSLEEELGFVWDGSHLPQEIQPDGRYIYINTDQDSYGPPAQVRNLTNEDGEIGQQAHYSHFDQIGIPREMTDIHGNLLRYGEYTAWGRLKYFFKNNLGQNRLRIRSGRSYSKNTRTNKQIKQSKKEHKETCVTSIK